MFTRAMTIAFFLSLSVAFLFTLHCSSNPTMAGGVETTNGLTIIASGMTVHGRAPIGSMVSAFPDTFNPVSGNARLIVDGVSIDSGGTFSFERLGDSGAYNIIAINALSRKGAIASSLYLRPGASDSIFIPFDTLGAINGFALRARNSDTLALKNFPVYLAGSNFFARTDSTGHYRISDIPLGKYRVIIRGYISAVVGDNEFNVVQIADLNAQNTDVVLNFKIN